MSLWAWILDILWVVIIRPLVYERVYLPLCQLADTLSYPRGQIICAQIRFTLPCNHQSTHWTNAGSMLVDCLVTTPKIATYKPILWNALGENRVIRPPPPYFIVLASLVKTKESRSLSFTEYWFNYWPTQTRWSPHWCRHRTWTRMRPLLEARVCGTVRLQIMRWKNYYL